MDWEKPTTTWLSEDTYLNESFGLDGGRMYNYGELDSKKIEYIAVGGVEELPEGERFFLEIDGDPIVVFNVAGGLFAIADLCSHDSGPLGEGELDDHAVVCPRHGARFDIRTGKVLTMPAIIDIPAYPVRVREGQIEIGLPVET
jgi:3-phenylpropionate/trans-cinnamate dioxygenase ferredoxin component